MPNSKFYLVILFLIASFILDFNSAYAQLTIIDINANAQNINNESNLSCNVIISDTLDCSAIAIELSEGVNDSILFIREYVFDQEYGLPNGVTWERNLNIIRLGLGIFSSYPTWKLKIRLKNNQNSWVATEEIMFN